MNRIPALSLAFGLCLAAVPALAQEVKVGDLSIETPWARATPKGADVGAGYLEIRNAGATPDKLTGGSADFASGVEVHEMKMDNGVMKMRLVPGGLEIPAHGVVKLAPSGFHLMFTGLKRPLAKGETIKATLTFEHAGPVAVDFPVQSIGAAGPAAEPQERRHEGDEDVGRLSSRRRQSRGSCARSYTVRPFRGEHDSVRRRGLRLGAGAA